MVKLIIFDLDGTLLNTLEDLADATNYLLRKNDYPIHPVNAYRYFVGNGIRKLIERAIPESERCEQHIEELFKDFVPYYEKHKADKTHVYEGVAELLLALQRRDIRLAIASNKVQEAMEPLIEHYFPEIHFDVVLGNRPGVPPKPDPAIVKDILQQMLVEASDTLYVGDTAVDMQTAQAAGLRKVGVLWGFRTKEELEQAGADVIISKPQEILSLL